MCSFRHGKVNTGLNVLIVHSSFSYHKTTNYCRGVSLRILVFWKQWEMSWERSCLRLVYQWTVLPCLFYSGRQFFSLFDHLRSHEMYTLVTTKLAYLQVRKSLLLTDKIKLIYCLLIFFDSPRKYINLNLYYCAKYTAMEVPEGKWKKKSGDLCFKSDLQGT